MHPHNEHRGPHGHGGLGHGVHAGMGHRARRGNVLPAVIALLKEQDMHGYQIIQEIAERSGGAWTPSPGSIYPTLQLLEDQGLVASEKADGKRVFSLTEAGREHAATLPEAAPWDEMVAMSDPSRRLRETFHGLMGATMQIGRAGTADQIEKTVVILSEARSRIYQTLAGDE
jgi:DNA-binding PadR family transcriptional regulator